MGLKFTVILIGCFSWFNVSAQSINIGSSRALGILYQNELDLFDNNQAYQFQFRSGYRPLAIGIEVRTIDWGNQIGISLLYNGFKSINKNWGFQYDLGMIHSIALFRPTFKYSLGILGRTAIAYQFNEKNRLELGIGARYDRILAYRDFGAINQTIELPISLSITRLLFTEKDE